MRDRGRWRWGVAGLVVALGVVAVWLIPWDDSAPTLAVVARSGSGAFGPTVRVPRAWADTATGLPDGAVRVPLVLAVRNDGEEPARPGRLRLSVPVHYRLSAGDGRRIPRRLSPGAPLVEYDLRARFPVIGPGQATALSAPDTLFLNVVIPSVYCVATSDSVPTFIPAPPLNSETLARVRIFYSLDGGDLDRRQTGLLTVHLDPGLLERAEPEPVPTFPVEMREPEAALPEMSALIHRGSRRTLCGEATRPIEFLSTLWETPGGGRMLVLDYGGAPRKYLFDLDRDSIIEREMWDPDGDGMFEARSKARLPIPGYLLPPPVEPPFDPEILASLSDEEMARLQVFGDALRGPYTPRTSPEDTAPRLHAFGSSTITREREDEAGGQRAAAPRPEPTPPARRPPRLLGVPADRDAGADAGPERRARERSPERAQEPADAGAPEPQPAPRPADEAPDIDLLGTPVDSVRPPPDPPGG